MSQNSERGASTATPPPTATAACDASKAPASLSELCQLLHQELDDKGIHEMARMDVARIQSLMESYASKAEDWAQFSHFDEGRYTRNLVDAGNGKFNLMILCWPAGVQSPIHDHAGAHCLMKVLDGEVKESRYSWPNQSGPKPLMPKSLIPSAVTRTEYVATGPMDVEKETTLSMDQVAYIHDKIGLHRVSNPTGANAVTLHLYCPPYETCKTFDEKTSIARASGRIVFYSENGQRTSPTTASLMQ